MKCYIISLFDSILLMDETVEVFASSHEEAEELALKLKPHGTITKITIKETWNA